LSNTIREKVIYESLWVHGDLVRISEVVLRWIKPSSLFSRFAHAQRSAGNFIGGVFASRRLIGIDNARLAKKIYLQAVYRGNRKTPIFSFLCIFSDCDFPTSG
jgi:hypothetical protein